MKLEDWMEIAQKRWEGNRSPDDQQDTDCLVKDICDTFTPIEMKQIMDEIYIPLAVISENWSLLKKHIQNSNPEDEKEVVRLLSKGYTTFAIFLILLEGNKDKLNKFFQTRERRGI